MIKPQSERLVGAAVAAHVVGDDAMLARELARELALEAPGGSAPRRGSAGELRPTRVAPLVHDHARTIRRRHEHRRLPSRLGGSARGHGDFAPPRRPELTGPGAGRRCGPSGST